MYAIHTLLAPAAAEVLYFEVSAFAPLSLSLSLSLSLLPPDISAWEL